MVRYRRITRRGEYQIRIGYRWVKPTGTEAHPEKIKRWRDMAEKRKKKKE